LIELLVAVASTDTFAPLPSLQLNSTLAPVIEEPSANIPPIQQFVSGSLILMIPDMKPNSFWVMLMDTLPLKGVEGLFVDTITPTQLPVNSARIPLVVPLLQLTVTSSGRMSRSRLMVFPVFFKKFNYLL
jgi:hypothetical protein